MVLSRLHLWLHGFDELQYVVAVYFAASYTTRLVVAICAGLLVRAVVRAFPRQIQLVIAEPWSLRCTWHRLTS